MDNIMQQDYQRKAALDAAAQLQLAYAQSNQGAKVSPERLIEDAMRLYYAFAAGK